MSPNLMSLIWLRANTVQLARADLVPGLKWALPWAGRTFWLSFFGLDCAQMAPGRAESDFGRQGLIDTLGLKQIFLIFSVVLSCPSTSWGIYNSRCHVKRAAKTCNELNSDVACSATHESTCFAANQVSCCRKLDSSSTFCNKIYIMLRVLPTQNKPVL